MKKFKDMSDTEIFEAFEALLKQRKEQQRIEKSWDACEYDPCGDAQREAQDARAAFGKALREFFDAAN